MHARDHALPGDVPLPAGAEILEASGWRGTGNVLLLYRDAKPPAVLKIYRVRRSRTREMLRGISHRWLEGKRGASARARRDTEWWSLKVWLREGFDAVRPLEWPAPDGLEQFPVLWIEYVRAPTLQSVLRDGTLPLPRKIEHLGQLAASSCRRHQRAFELNEVLLIQEHAVMNHVLVEHGRLVTFDLENGFRPGFPMLEAAAQELAGYTRSLLQCAENRDTGALLKAWVDGYGDRSLLRSIVDHAVGGTSLLRRVKRLQDSKRGESSKTAAVERLRGLL